MSKTFLEVNGNPAVLPIVMPTKRQAQPNVTTASTPIITTIDSDDYLNMEGKLSPYDLPDIDAEAARTLANMKQTSVYALTRILSEELALRASVLEDNDEAQQISKVKQQSNPTASSGIIPNDSELRVSETKPLLVSLDQQGLEGQRAPESAGPSITEQRMNVITDHKETNKYSVSYAAYSLRQPTNESTIAH